MSTPRIHRRRSRFRWGPLEYVSSAVAALLTLVSLYRRHRIRSSARERLSAVTEREYDEWLSREKRRTFV